MGSVCFFNTAKAWGGGEKWHFETSRYLHCKGYDVFVFAHEKSSLLQKLIAEEIPCKGITISNLSFLNPLLYLKFKNLFDKHEFDTIVMNLSRDLKIAGPSAKKAKIQRIIYRRGSAIPIKNTFLNRYYFKNVLTHILANSEATKRTILKNNPFLFSEEKIMVIYNGVDTKIDIPERQNINEFTLLNLGRLEYQKNQKFLIELAYELKKREVKFKMLIGGDGSLKYELETLIQKLNVSNEVHMIGFIENPIEFISKCDVFLLPSLWEGFGYVLAEASLCKKPIIAFNISSNPELVIDSKTGYLVQKNNLNAFADKVTQLYNNKKNRTRFGINGHEHIVTNFDKNMQLKKLKDYLMYA